MRGKLFDCRLLEAAPDAKLEVVTPLGILTFDAEFDGVVIGDLKTSSAYRLERDGYLLNWTLDSIVAELLLCRPRFTLPEGMAVTDCWAGMWRLRATTAPTSSGERPEFSCRWESGYQLTEGGPNSGEWLAAQTWENAEAVVTIGTADGGGLAGQANIGILPHRWAKLLGDSYGGIMPDTNTGKIDPVMYLEDGFRLVLPELNAGETCQVQFVAAWAPKTDDGENASPWFAVDLAPEAVLAGAACEN